MQKKIHFTLLQKYFISYFAIALVPIIIMSIVFYKINIANQHTSINDNRLADIKQVSSKMDYMINSFSNNALNISSKYAFPELFDQNNNKNIDGILAYYEKIYSEKINILLYKHGDKNIYMSSGEISYINFEKMFGNNDDITLVNFYHKINSSNYITIFSTQFDFNKDIDKSYLCFLYPIPYGYINPKASMTYLIETDEINEIFEKYMGIFKGDLFIFNQNLDLISYNNINTDKKIENINDAANKINKIRGSGVFNINIEGKNEVLLKVVSENNEISYCIIMEEDEFYKNGMQTQKLLITMILFMIFSAALFALLFSIYQYKPLKKVISKITSDEFKNIKNLDEYNFITDSYENIVNKSKGLMLQIDRQKPIIIQQCLNNLVLYGEDKQENMNYYLQCANITFDYDYFFVLLVSSKSSKDVLVGIDDLIEHIFFNGINGYGFELVNEKNIIAAIVNIDKAVNNKETILKYANVIKEKIYSEFDINVIIGIGQTYESKYKCDISFLEAKTALQTREKNESNIYLFANNSIKSDEVYDFPVMEQALYIQSIHYGNLDVALESLDNIVKKISNNTKSFLITQYICFQIINNITKFIKQYNIENNKSIMKEVLLFNSIEEFHNKMKDLTKLLCENVNKKKNVNYDKLKKDIISFLNQNYNNKNLSLESTTDNFNISISYLGKIIKEETQCSFNQYITLLRINEAKRLLKDTDMKINEIVSQIGYIDLSSFIRRFKSIEGVTPNDYRKMTRDNKY